MTTLPESPRSAAGTDHTDAGLLRAVADMRPGWAVLRDCWLADDGRGAGARVRYALLHPQIGIALLDVPPGATTLGAPDRMRRSLDAAGFRLAFGDYPPIVYLCVPSRALSDIASPLAREFGSLPPLALLGGGAWVAAAQRALAAAGGPLRVSGQAADGGRSEPIVGSRRGSPTPGRAESRSVPRPALGLRGLGVFWGAVTMAFGGGALVLQHLGPPEPPVAAAHAGTGPEGARVASEEAWLAPASPAAARPPAPGPMLALWPAERMPTRFDAARAGGVATLEPGDAAAVGTRLDGDRSAPMDIVAAVLRPPLSQVAASRAEVPTASNDGADDRPSPEATRPPPPPSETGSDAPPTASGSEGAPAGGGAPPAAVGTAAAGAAADDEAPASVSGSEVDAAAARGRDAGPAVPPLPGLGEAAAPAQAPIPTAPPAGAPEVPAAADSLDGASRASAPSEAARAPEAPPAQEGGRAAAPQTADAQAADPAASAPETAPPNATATADTPPAAGPPPLTRAEPLPAPVQPAAEAAGPNAAAAASAAESAARPPPPPPPGASPAAVAALLARGDALIATGNVAAARLVYQRAAAHASARAATATGKTYDPRFLQAIGAIGVVADPDAAAAWYRRGSALGDEDATPLLSGLEARASR